jgi:hypothetical protein
MTLQHGKPAGSNLTDPNSEDYQLLKQDILLEVDRIITAKNWKSHLNPQPQLCRFE